MGGTPYNPLSRKRSWNFAEFLKGAPCASHFTHRAHNISGTQREILCAECPLLMV